MLSRLLLLEDDILFSETLLDLLEEEGYEVTHAPNGQSALDFAFNEKFDLYLFDINVPLIDGITLLSELRSASDDTPAIFLTSHKDREKLKEAFSSGADDYLKKPFDNDELLFRIEALLKRTQKEIPECVSLLCHDKKLKRFLYDEKPLELSKKEYELLCVLVANVNQPVPKEVISDQLWSHAESHSQGAIRVYINRLKQMLPQMSIENIRGVGYRLVC